MELEALLLEQALRLLADFAVHAGQDAVEELDHRHLGAEPTPDRTELEPDHPGPDDDQRLRRLRQRQRAGRGDDLTLVDLDSRQAGDVGARGDDDRLGLVGRFGAVGADDHDVARRRDATLALQPVDLVLPEQEGDAVDVSGDGVVLVLHHRAKIELGRRDDDAERAQPVARLLEHFGGVQQRFRGNAADVEAGPAERLALLDHGDFHAQLRGADRADVAAGAGADHHNVVSHSPARFPSIPLRATPTGRASSAGR